MLLVSRRMGCGGGAGHLPRKKSFFCSKMISLGEVLEVLLRCLYELK